MPFERFRKLTVTRTSVPTITLHRNRIDISFNAAALACLGEPAYVELHFDPERRIVGFKAGDPDDADAYVLTRQKGSKSPQTPGGYVSAGALINHYGFGDRVGKRFSGTLEETENGALLTFDLTQAGEEVRGRLGRRHAGGAADPPDGSGDVGGDVE